MQSKISFFNKTIFKKNMSQFWLIMVAIFLVYLFLLPISLVTSINDAERYYDSATAYFDEYLRYTIESQFALVTSCLFVSVVSIITAVGVFSYLYNSRSSNMMHAFPVTRLELFVTNTISGLVILLTPMIVNAIIALIILSGVDSSYVYLVFVWLYFELMYTLFFFGFSVFCCMFSGQIIGSPVFYGIFNLAYVGLAIIIKGIESTYGYGLGTEVPDIDSVFFPFEYLYAHTGLESVGAVDSNGYVKYKVVGQNIACIYALIGIALIVGAFLVYRKKKLETAGDWITVGWAKPLFRWGIGAGFGFISALVISTLFNFESEAMFWAQSFIYTIVFFLLAQMLIQKGFKVKNKKILIECVVCAALFTGFSMVADINGYWRENYVPEESEVEGVIVRGNNQFVDDSEDTIEKMLELHRDFIVAKSEFDKQTENGYSIDFIYYMKDGSLVRRDYYLDTKSEVGIRLYNELRDYFNTPEKVKTSLFSNHYDTAKIKEMAYQKQVNDYVSDSNVEEKDFDVIYQAILKDIDEGNIKIVEPIESLDEGYTSYVTNLSLTMSFDEKVINTDGVYLSEKDRYQKEKYTYVEINPNCKNVIDTMIKLGYYSSEDDVVTWESINN